MHLRILCSGHLVRYPLGGHSWHHLQYLIGFKRMGHDVFFFEDYGWPNSCYDPSKDVMTDDPGYGLQYVGKLFRSFDLEKKWSYLGEDGIAYGMSRNELTEICRHCDVYFDLSNVNWIPELELCRRRVLVDTDPVFNQIGAFGMSRSFSEYDALFTYGENVHQQGCQMPDAGFRWLPTRQPVVLDLWPVNSGNCSAPFTSVMSWSDFGPQEHQGKQYGQKNVEFEPFFSLPKTVGEPMELALAGASESVIQRLRRGGWRFSNPQVVTKDPWTYQNYLGASRAEFCVAKHAYVTTQCGWFSDRSSAYLAMGRPVVLQDTGFSRLLPSDSGLLAYRNPDEAILKIQEVTRNYLSHCRAARSIAEEYFDSNLVLGNLLDTVL